ncbi:respiratory nitrate reductase subunit gamma [Desulfuromonas carbonis]|uniref:respiratory nitrate reductase subunit gamma n=1 Tax=Desulfuromonas sp. DDH964 TaxID=1823759 RepID=UPI00078CE53F|nr:respiratory nitrate reductase subunit gamma [Desulfuromonas sp. DDH964]AMV72889.1 Nitrate reductase-like protein NarX [Desulfuromonas sp. DDH964]
MIDQILFGVFPYVAVALAIAVGCFRYAIDRYSWSSQSSQFLESRALYWGSVPWHYAILLILLAHLLAFLFPAGWGTLLGEPARLYFLEVTGMVFGVTTVIAMLLLIVRRGMDPRLAVVTSRIDWLLLVLLLVQVATGVMIAISLRWGGVWYLHNAVPWLRSLVLLQPDVQHLAVLPVVVKLHAFNAFLLIAVFPFSRLVHVVSVPLSYLSRPYQVVVWYRERRRQAGI